jgi:hypothetical protein
MRTNFTFSKQVRIAVAAALPMVFCLDLSAQKENRYRLPMKGWRPLCRARATL